jgi:hypothetical protein
LHNRSRVARHAIVAWCAVWLGAGKVSLSCLSPCPGGPRLPDRLPGLAPFSGRWRRSRRLARTNSPAPALKGYAHGFLDRPASCRRRCSWNGTNSFAGNRALLGLVRRAVCFSALARSASGVAPDSRPPGQPIAPSRSGPAPQIAATSPAVAPTSRPPRKRGRDSSMRNGRMAGRAAGCGKSGSNTQ